MSVPPTESFVTAATPSAAEVGKWGQAVSSGSAAGGPGYTLVSFSTAPVPTSYRLDYVVLCHEDADDWRWTFRAPGSKWVRKATSGEPIAFVDYERAGTLETRVDVIKDNAVQATLTMTQNVEEPSAELTTLLTSPYARGFDLGFAFREICEGFKTYIEEAAAATGTNGIPARLLAAVLLNETRGRPKDGSPRALAFRRVVEQDTFYTPRIDAAFDWVDRKAGVWEPKIHLHDIRDVEVELIRDYLNSRIEVPLDYTFRRTGRKTLGVGQIAMTTAAMTLGKTPWRELSEGTIVNDLDAIEDAFQDLSNNDYLEIFNTLRFPKTNILCVAQLLAKIKNRPSRFPGLTPRQVLSDPRAVEVIATEYNRGAFTTPTAAFQAIAYGVKVRNNVIAPSAVGLDRFFPDPPP